MLDFLEISEDQLPRLLASGNIAGQVIGDIGVPRETVVTVAPIDQIAAAFGAGNIKPGMITETTGSAMAVCATLDYPKYLPSRQAGLYRHACPGKYALLPWIPASGMILRWFRDEFCTGLSYRDMDNEADKVVPGSDGLILLPHLSGAVCPEVNENARGVFYGISLAHKRKHFLRAIMESIAYILRDNIEMLESIGIADDSITSLGGGAASRVWLQIKANVLSKQVKILKCDEATCLGTAMLAGIGAGLFTDVEQAVDEMVDNDRIIDPENETAKIYNDTYSQYKRINGILLPTFGG
jgi:xylulokinase